MEARKKAKKLRDQSRDFIGKLYEKSGQFEKAAVSYEASAVKAKGKKAKASFYYNAAIIRQGMRFYTAAINNYRAYANLSSNNDK